MTGRIVRSLRGRDKGKLMLVVGASDEGLLVCDGKERPLERPKTKNIKHLCFTNDCLNTAQYSSNRRLRAALYRYSLGADTEREETQCQKRI